MRARWTLLQEGDRKNIPQILKLTGSIDLVHYDSAKDPNEMRWVLDQTAPLLTPNAVVVLDDVDRHGLMQEIVRGTDQSWFVFRNAAVLGLTEAIEARGK
jgi:predicted O-methyltransferase YrrM